MNGKSLIWIGVGLLMLTGGVVVYQKIRGLRNKNPANIRFNKANKWQGQIGSDDKGFVIFDDASNGIRALAKLLRNYQSKHGLKTVSEIINKYAPPNENLTGAYVDSVAKKLNVNPNQEITLTDDVLFHFVNAIIKHENGVNPYDSKFVQEAISRA